MVWVERELSLEDLNVAEERSELLFLYILRNGENVQADQLALMSIDSNYLERYQ